MSCKYPTPLPLSPSPDGSEEEVAVAVAEEMIASAVDAADVVGGGGNGADDSGLIEGERTIVPGIVTMCLSLFLSADLARA